MKALSLFGVFVLAKTFVLAASPPPVSAWTPAAFLWEDALVALLLALVRPGKLAWTAYGFLVLYAALNVPVTRVLGTPLTSPMVRAARGTLADSIVIYVTSTNVALIFSVLAAGAILPILLRRASRRVLTVAAVAGLLLVVAGPAAVGRLETRGLHRNPAVALVVSAFPRVAAGGVEADWRSSPFEPGPAEDLSRYRGTAAGRNVVLIALESTGARYLRPYGAAEDPMPNLTQLAGESILFESAYAVYPESIKGLWSVLCSAWPAMDVPAEEHGRLPTPSLAQVLRAQGYHTGLFHSGRFGYLGMDSIVRGRGFDVLEDAGDIGGNRESSFGVDEPATVKRVLSWIDGVPRGRKFLAAWLPIAGHHPYSGAAGPFPPAEEENRYRNALFEADAALGELLRGLRSRGLLGETLFVIYGDHGEAFGQHGGNFGHTLHVYEENVRVPLLLVAPGLTREPLRLKRVASLVDAAPTLLDLLGVAPPEGWNGASLLDGPSRSALLFADYSLALLGLRDGRWKFIHEVESGRSRLFDLERDPGELRDLSAAEPARTCTYRENLLSWCAARRAAVGAAGR